MKKFILAAATAAAFSASPALAADLYKAPPMEPLPAVVAPSMFDVTFGTALTSDYVLRGISQSNRRPAIQGYFEGQFMPTST